MMDDDDDDDDDDDRERFWREHVNERLTKVAGILDEQNA
jgi:hypothetical protein